MGGGFGLGSSKQFRVIQELKCPVHGVAAPEEAILENRRGHAKNTHVNRALRVEDELLLDFINDTASGAPMRSPSTSSSGSRPSPYTKWNAPFAAVSAAPRATSSRWAPNGLSALTSIPAQLHSSALACRSSLSPTAQIGIWRHFPALVIDARQCRFVS
jgi:hypothetical protein